jgi:hypothetical protein
VQRRFVSWLRETVRTKRGFLNYCLVGFGIPEATLLVLNFRQYGDAAWTLYLICVAFAGAYAFGLGMWHFIGKANASKKDPS